MKLNMGNADRIIRALVAVVLFALVLNGVLNGAWEGVAYAVIVIFGATSLFGSCPLYSVLGISSCPINSHKY